MIQTTDYVTLTQPARQYQAFDLLEAIASKKDSITVLQLGCGLSDEGTCFETLEIRANVGRMFSEPIRSTLITVDHDAHALSACAQLQYSLPKKAEMAASFSWEKGRVSAVTRMRQLAIKYHKKTRTCHFSEERLMRLKMIHKDFANLFFSADTFSACFAFNSLIYLFKNEAFLACTSPAEYMDLLMGWLEPGAPLFIDKTTYRLQLADWQHEHVVDESLIEPHHIIVILKRKKVFAATTTSSN